MSQEVYDPRKAYTDPEYSRSDPTVAKFQADRLLAYAGSKHGPYRSQEAPQNALAAKLESLTPEEKEALLAELALQEGTESRVAALTAALEREQAGEVADSQGMAVQQAISAVRAQIRAIGGAPLAPQPAAAR